MPDLHGFGLRFTSLMVKEEVFTIALAHIRATNCLELF